LCQAEPSYYSSMIIGIQTTKTRRQSGSWQTFFLLQMQPISYNIKRISTKKKAHLVARPVYRVFKTESTSSRQTEADRSWEKSVKTRRNNNNNNKARRWCSSSSGVPPRSRALGERRRALFWSLVLGPRFEVFICLFWVSFVGCHF
jgi:hypothetical protein